MNKLLFPLKACVQAFFLQYRGQQCAWGQYTLGDAVLGSLSYFEKRPLTFLLDLSPSRCML